MELDLTSVDAKLLRAEAHFIAVYEDIRSKIQTCAYSIEHRRNDDFTELSVLVRTSGGTLPLLWWTLVIADCINNLRTALDYLIFAIAVHESGKNPPPKEKKLAFIIADEPADFSSALGKMGDLSIDARNAIESVQPYNRKNPYLPPFLSILRDLSNTDKHRLLRMAATTPGIWDFNFSGPTDPTIERKFFFTHSEIEDGAEVAFAKSSKSDPQLTTYGRLGLCISIWHGFKEGFTQVTNPGSDRSEVIALLQVLFEEVKSAINIVSASIP